jgi:hypothetical protein
MGPACRHVDLDWISSQVVLPQDVEIVFKEDRVGICEVVLAIDGDLVPFYAGKDFIVAGRMFKKQKDQTRDTMDGLSEIAEEVWEEAREKDALAAEERRAFLEDNMSTLSSLVSIAYQPDESTGDFYMVTDPNCSFCRELLPELEIAAFEAGMALRIILFPLLGPDSEKMAARAICSNYSLEAYQAMTGEEDPTSCKEADKRIEETMDTLLSAGFDFVPFVVAGDGSWLVEGDDIQEIRNRLGLAVDGQEDDELDTRCDQYPDD